MFEKTTIVGFDCPTALQTRLFFANNLTAFDTAADLRAVKKIGIGSTDSSRVLIHSATLWLLGNGCHCSRRARRN